MVLVLVLGSPLCHGHGILPDEIPMAAGTALRNPGELPATTVAFSAQWQPQSLRLPLNSATSLTIHNSSNDWHLFALGDSRALSDQNLIHRLMQLFGRTVEVIPFHREEISKCGYDDHIEEKEFHGELLSRTGAA